MPVSASSPNWREYPEARWGHAAEELDAVLVVAPGEVVKRRRRTGRALVEVSIPSAARSLENVDDAEVVLVLGADRAVASDSVPALNAFLEGTGAGRSA
jgi:hypothetical protein